MRITTKLWEHQEDMVLFILKRFRASSITEVGSGWDTAIINPGFAWLLAGCGTGKTLVAYKVMQRMGIKKMLVLTTKAAATKAWVGDAEEHTQGLYVVAPVGKTNMWLGPVGHRPETRAPMLLIQRDLSVLFHQLNLIRSTGLVYPGLQRCVHAKRHEVALAGDCLHPIILITLRRIRREVDVV